MKEEDIRKYIQNKLKKSFENFQIFEEGIDLETQIEFEKLTKSFFEKDFQEIDINTAEKNLYDTSFSETDKKEILISLSFSDDVKAYRLIEKFRTNSNNTLKEWSALSLQKSRAHIEHSLSNEDKVYISSGLGGSGDKLRYFLVFSATKDITFTDFHKKIVKKEIDFTLTKFDGVTENITFYDYFVTVVCLIPIHISLDQIFKNILDECNELGNFMSDKVIATNTEKIDEETIVKILNEDPEAIKPFENYKDSDLFGLEDFDDDDYDEFDDEYDDFDDDDDDYY
ncbi:MAG: hypothetical protein K8R54_04815 [Bacteroidales bacterium]|nr:hypothetical protein [Bacteroidales bacterium]